MAANNILASSVQIDENNLKRLAKLSALTNIPISGLVNDAIDGYLKEQSKFSQIGKSFSGAEASTGKIELLAAKFAIMEMAIDTLQQEVAVLKVRNGIQEASTKRYDSKKLSEPLQHLDLRIFKGELPDIIKSRPHYLQQDAQSLIDTPQFVKDFEEAISLSPRNVAISEFLAAKGHKDINGRKLSAHRVRSLREVLKMLYSAALDKQKAEADQN
jgi:Ribbon-helix-helix domain